MRFSTLILAGLGLLLVSCTCGEKTPGEDKPDGAAESAVARTARVVFTQGSVRVKRSGSMEWLTAENDMELSIDDKVRTLRDSFINIEFEHGGTLRVGPESLVVVTDLRVEQRTKARRYTFTLMEGKVEAELDALEQDESEFKIRTTTAEASLLRREVSFQ